MVVPPEDSGSLAAAIAALAADPQLRAEMGRVGRAFAERCYDRAALAREYRKILDLDSFGCDAMRLLVTGGSGFLGGYVLAEAARRGHSCVALARSAGGRADGGRARCHAAGGRS